MNASDSTCAAWLVAARRGSPDALGNLLEAMRPQLLRQLQAIFPRSIRSKVGASDLVQETFLEGHRRFDTFVGGSAVEFQYWIRAILANKVTDSVRRFDTTQAGKVRREVRLTDSWADLLMVPDDDPQQTLLADEAGRILAETLARAMARLTPLQQDVFRRRFDENQGFDQIADAIGRSEAAVRKLWCRSFQDLKRYAQGGPDDRVPLALQDDP
ncbi:MAG: sigma-70 family RNA polymerase sigma factor [Planctomycetia bacterium]|nr:sigma-70 family RNA polymerase sigma factor [Planctomycetia bacterium]